MVRTGVHREIVLSPADADSQGVETMLPWSGKAIHQFAALGLPKFDLPRTDRLFRRVLMLPMYAELTDDEARYVADCVRRFYR